MAISVLHISLLLTLLCVTDGQSTTSTDSHCSYTFKVPTNDCGQSPKEDQLTKSLLVALQTQVKFLARNQEKLTEENKIQAEIIRNLTENTPSLTPEFLHQLTAGTCENPFIVICFNHVQLTFTENCTAFNGHIGMISLNSYSCSKCLH